MSLSLFISIAASNTPVSGSRKPPTISPVVWFFLIIGFFFTTIIFYDTAFFATNICLSPINPYSFCIHIGDFNFILIQNRPYLRLVRRSTRIKTSFFQSAYVELKLFAAVKSLCNRVYMISLAATSPSPLWRYPQR